MVFVGSELMIVVDFVLIKKGVRFGNIVFYFCGVGRRLECCMSNRGKLFLSMFIIFSGFFLKAPLSLKDTPPNAEATDGAELGKITA